MKYLTIALAMLVSGCANMHVSGSPGSWDTAESKSSGFGLHASADTAIAADAATTIIGITSGAAHEGNPLISSPGAGLAALALRFGLVQYADGAPEPKRTTQLSILNAISWGAVANNLVVLLAHSSPAGIIAGLATGGILWKSTEEQRQFAEICAAEKLRNPALDCVWNPA